MKTYTIKNAKKIRIIFYALLMITTFSCTDLKDQSFNAIIDSQFKATDEDLAALAGTAYVNWRIILLNGMDFTAPMNSPADASHTGTTNGWVDGGVYRDYEHKWTTDDDVVINVESNLYWNYKLYE